MFDASTLKSKFKIKKIRKLIIFKMNQKKLINDLIESSNEMDDLIESVKN